VSVRFNHLHLFVMKYGWVLEIIIDLPIGFPINNIMSLWVCVCVVLFYYTDIGESLRSRGHSLRHGTWGGRILTLHLNYVAGYTGPLLFLFERTHNFYVDNHGLGEVNVHDSFESMSTSTVDMDCRPIFFWDDSISTVDFDRFLGEIDGRSNIDLIFK